MRILRLHNRQLTRGGADIQLEREGEALAARGHTVETMLVDTAEVNRRGPLRTGVAAFWNTEATRDLRRLLDTFDPDVVHVHTPFPVMSPAVIRTASNAGYPVVVTAQAWRFSCPGGLLYRDERTCEDCVGRRLKYPAVVHRCYHDALLPSIAIAGSLSLHHAIGTFAHHVDRFLALTPFMRERLIAEGIAPGNVTVKPNSSPDPGPPRAERTGRLLFAGRFVPSKGVHTVLEAWDDPELDVELVIAGDGELRSDVEAAAAANPRIDYRGWLDGPAIGALLAESDGLILPSAWYEGLPVILTEAFAAGTPVISSDVGNFTDLVEPGVQGTRFATGDAGELRAAVRWLMDDADRPALRAAARRTFEEQFAAEPVLDTLEGVYAQVVAEHDGSGRRR